MEKGKRIADFTTNLGTFLMKLFAKKKINRNTQEQFAKMCVQHVCDSQSFINESFIYFLLS